MTEQTTLKILDAAIVERAIEALHQAEAPPVGSWKVAGVEAHRNSSIIYVDVPEPAPAVRLVYKTLVYLPDGWLPLNTRLTASAVGLLEAEGFRASPILAGDESRKVVVTRFIPGDILRSPDPSHAGLAENERKVYRMVGRACRILESVAPPFSDDQVKETAWRKFKARLEQSTLEPGFAGEVERFAADALESAAAGPAAIVMTHQDMTFKNIVLDEDIVGLIDLGFGPSLRGHSVTKMLHRLQFANRRPTPVTQEAIDALLEGYGPWESEDGMKFFRVHRLVGLLSAPAWRTSVTPRLRRARAELEGLVAG